MENSSQNSPDKFEDLAARAKLLAEAQASQTNGENAEFKLSVPDNLPTQELAATTEAKPWEKAKEWHASLTPEQRREITLELLGMDAKENSTQETAATQREAVIEQASHVESGSAALGTLTGLNDNRLGGRGGFIPESRPGPVVQESTPAPTPEVPASETVPMAAAEETPLVPEAKESQPSLVIEGEAGGTPRDLVEKLLREVAVNENFPEIASFAEEDLEILKILVGNKLTEDGLELNDNQLSYAA